MRRRAAVLVLIAAVVVGCAHGEKNASRGTPQFHLEWQAVSDPRGPVVRGQVFNGHALPARDIHLLVEGFDADGQVVSTSTTVLRRIVLARERAPFDVLMPGPADRYRVTVVTFDLVMPRDRR